MNKLLGVALVTVIVLGLVPLARSIESLGGPPPGIALRNWVPMGPEAGFVVTVVPMGSGPRSEPDVVTGYFMVRHGGNWSRVDASPAQTYRAALR